MSVQSRGKLVTQSTDDFIIDLEVFFVFAYLVSPSQMRGTCHHSTPQLSTIIKICEMGQTTTLGLALKKKKKKNLHQFSIVAFMWMNGLRKVNTEH